MFWSIIKHNDRSSNFPFFNIYIYILFPLAINTWNAPVGEGQTTNLGYKTQNSSIVTFFLLIFSLYPACISVIRRLRNGSVPCPWLVIVTSASLCGVVWCVLTRLVSTSVCICFVFSSCFFLPLMFFLVLTPINIGWSVLLRLYRSCPAFEPTTCPTADPTPRTRTTMVASSTERPRSRKRKSLR